MTVTVAPLEDDIFTALRSVLLGMVPAAQVVMGQDNRVAAPLGDFVVMTPLFRERMATNVDAFLDTYPGNTQTKTLNEAVRFTVQLGVFGPNASDNAQIIATMFRDEYVATAFASLNASVAPLFAGEPRQMQFVNGEMQYENQWSVDVVMQATIGVTISQQFAGAANVGLISVDAIYHP